MRLNLGLGDAYDEGCLGPGWTQAPDGSCQCIGVIASDEETCTDNANLPQVNGVVNPLPPVAASAIGTAAVLPVIPTPQFCNGLFYAGSPGSGLGSCIGPLDIGTWALVAGVVWWMTKK